jgi:Helix-turn-helix domain
MTEPDRPEKLWEIEDVSVYLGIPVGTLYQWRHRRKGPPAAKVGRHLRYKFCVRIALRRAPAIR